MEFATVLWMSGGVVADLVGRVSGRLSPEGADLVLARLRGLHEASGVSANKLADRCLLPRSTLKDVLSGKTEKLTLPVMLHLVHGLRLGSIEELIAPLGSTQLRAIEFPGIAEAADQEVRSA
jgi:hypothetical protein